MAQGLPECIVVLTIHATLFFGWTLYFVYQTWLIANGYVVRHRDLSVLGVSLATAMIIFDVLAAISWPSSLLSLGWVEVLTWSHVFSGWAPSAAQGRQLHRPDSPCFQ